MAYSNEHHISELLSRLYRQNDLTEVVDGASVCSAYHKVVGDLISRLTASVRFDNGSLYVHVLSAALRHELSMRQQGLMDKINEYVGRNVVTRIIFM